MKESLYAMQKSVFHLQEDQMFEIDCMQRTSTTGERKLDRRNVIFGFSRKETEK